MGWPLATSYRKSPIVYAMRNLNCLSWGEIRL
jgi:hypothetical protein